MLRLTRYASDRGSAVPIGMIDAGERAHNPSVASDRFRRIAALAVEAYNLPTIGLPRTLPAAEPPMHDTLLATPRFDVERRTYVCAGRDPVVREIVVHPGAVVVLPILGGERIVMIRQLRHAVDAELWELPAGTREPGESPLVTARRELIEETGYRAGAIEPFAEFYTSPGVMTERMHAFIATDLSEVGQRLEGHETIEVEVVRVADARDMVRRGEIHDGKTLAVLGMYLVRTDG
jgi:ADP-ribose pyrophosphatase